MKDQATAWRGAAAPAVPALQGSAPVFGALDLGTNNCRLLVARGPGSAGLHVIDAFSRIVRLGEGLALTGGLSAAAIERTIAALKICAAKLRKHQPCIARVVATEACRRAGNGDAFLERVTRETGLTIEVIGAGEEALLAVAGCSALLDPARRQAIMFDIGGRSPELMWLQLPAAAAAGGRGRGPNPRTAWKSAPGWLGVRGVALRHADGAA